MNDLARLVRAAGKVAVFSGAGVSTLCGIPDFRGPQGIYRLLDADRIFSLEQFEADPGFYYRASAGFLYNLEDCRPGPVHRICARLEAAGLLAGVITQNIDMLHGRAGSRTVIELHGSLRWHHCRSCGQRREYAAVVPVVRAGGLPRCSRCGDVLKPGVTFFGEMLPPGALEQALALAAGVDLMLVLGSSLVVQPAASVPLATVRQGGALAIINKGATPLDGLAVLRGADLLQACKNLQVLLDGADP